MKNKIKLGLIFMVLLIGINFIYAATTFSGGAYPATFSGGYSVYGTSVNPQFNNPGFLSVSAFTSPEVYWPKYNQGDCLERQDFIMQIAPGGCSPAVVRSDLLEEQNVPVFCKVMSVQLNPLIDVSKIRSLVFTQKQYPAGVSSISYFPAQAAVRSQTQLISSPIKDNLGYLVVVLSSSEYKGAERDMPDFVQGNVTATIDYDAEGAFGIGKNYFYISELSEEEWLRDYKKYGFWNGKGYVRVDSIDEQGAVISIYRDMDFREATVSLKTGEVSRDIYLNGFYCAAGMNVKIDKIDVPVETALLQVNDQQIWVARGDSILDGKCSITTLDAYAGGGSIGVSCKVSNGKFDLSLIPGKVSLIVNGETKDYMMGEKVVNNIYVAYAGKDVDETNFVILINDSLSYTANEFADKEAYDAIEKIVSGSSSSIDSLVKQIETQVKSQYRKKLSGVSATDVDTKVSIKVIAKGSKKISLKGKEFGIELVDVLVAKDRTWNNANVEEVLAKQYYDNAIKNYEDLASLYPNEKMEGVEDPYSVLGLYQAAELSRKFGMNEKAQEYYNRILKDYPDSSTADRVKRESQLLIKYDSSNSKAVVNINNEQYFFDLLDFKKPKREDLNANFLIDGNEVELGLNEIKVYPGATKKEEKRTIQLQEIKDDYVVIGYAKSGVDILGSGASTKKMNLKDSFAFDGLSIKLLNINLKKQVKLSLTPKVSGPRTESNFSFKIGIEKRAIKLSPDQTHDMISNLDKTIKEWGNVNDKLGEVVKTLKGACFATAGILTVKNLFSGLSGNSMARSELMTKPGGWNDFCGKQVSDKKFSSVQTCLVSYNAQIEKDIEIYSQQIQSTNKILEGIQQQVGVEGGDVLDLEKQTNYKKVEEQFGEEFKKLCSNANDQVTLPTKNSESIAFNSMCDWDTLTQDQKRDLITLYQTNQAASESGGSDVLKNLTSSELGKISLDAKNTYESEKARIAAEKDAKDSGWEVSRTDLFGDGSKPAHIETVKKSEAKGSVKEGDKVIRINVEPSIPKSDKRASDQVANKDVIVKLKQEGNVYTPQSFFDLSGNEIKPSNGKSYSDYEYINDFLVSKKATSFTPVNTAYKNPMKNPSGLTVKYFEKAPYKGLPSEVPFDVNNGWYVKMTYVLSGFGKPYDESGRVVNYWICNVGPNGEINFQQGIDDICRYYNGDTGVVSNDFGMSVSEAKNLISKAQQAIAEAARQYGQKKVKIGSQTFNSGIDFGGNAGRCSDFMSPQDCNILFNVCDPVICPSSRCDLGGNFPVDNVIQTGIIGGLMLCLPNYKEGIAIPICLSGVHAGIESYLSILTSVRDCLNESLASGQNIGFCDEVKSIYLCEFFWKQATPFLNVLVPKLIQSFFSQGVRGGGEYLTVQSAWDNTQKAIDYFKNEYAVNSMQAFTARSTEEIGTEACKSFVSVAYPNSGDFFNNLIEPDSPVQYSAWFSEDVLTTATVPSTSHYKVYYHIYSGQDQGAYYSVYLKDLPQTNYIFTSGVYIVDNGYIGKGSQVDQAKDFTAVSGYKQLCVSVNGKDECGFGKVSTSYLLNSISDLYAQEQASNLNIQTEKDCVAGTPSVSSLLQPNLEAGANAVLNPELYTSGIIRVCSTTNPGKKVLPTGEFDTTATTYDQWKEVGYCGDTTIKCWLDTNSVKNVIQDKSIENQTLNQINLESIGAGGYWDEEKSREVANEGENALQLNLKDATKTQSVENVMQPIINKLINLTNLAVDNKFRARGLFLLGEVYQKMADYVLPAPVIINTNKVSWEEAGYLENGIDHIRFYENNNLVSKEVMYFNYDLQEVVLVDNIRYKLARDSSNRVILNKIGVDTSMKPKGYTEEKTEPAKTEPANELPEVEDISLSEYYELDVESFIFEFEDGRADSNLFYLFKNGNWRFAVSQSSEGVVVDDAQKAIIFNIYNHFTDQTKKLINDLKGKRFDQGVDLLRIRTVRNEEGGWFDNTGLNVFFDGKERFYLYNNPTLESIDSLMKDLAQVSKG